MSDPREALVRSAWENFNAGDIAGVLATFHPEIVVHAPPTMANAGTFHGHDGFVAWIGEWNDAWDSFEAEVTETQLVGDAFIVTRVSQRGVGRGSGVEVTMETGWVYEVRDNLCVYLAVHPGFDAALDAARERIAAE